MEKKTQKLLQDLASGIFVTVLAVLMIVYFIPGQIKISTALGVDQSFNAQTFPFFAAWVILIPGVILTISSAVKLIRLKSEGTIKLPPVKFRDELRAIALIALFFLYVLLFATLGYIPATVIVPPLVLWLLGSRDWRYYAAVYGVGVVVYVAFKYLMSVPLP